VLFKAQHKQERRKRCVCVCVCAARVRRGNRWGNARGENELLSN